MTTLLANYQFLELENEQLKLRIKELTEPKYPEIAFHLQAEVKNGKKEYVIYDERGYKMDSFVSEDDEKAKQVFAQYKKKYTPTKKSIIKYGNTDGIFHHLEFYKRISIAYYPPPESPRITVMELYVVHIERCVTEIINIGENAVKNDEEAIARYDQIVADYIQKKQNPQKEILFCIN